MVKESEKTSLLTSQQHDMAMPDGTMSDSPPAPIAGEYHSLCGSYNAGQGSSINKDLARQTSIVDPRESLTISWEKLNVYLPSPPPKKIRLPCRKVEPPPPPKHILKDVYGGVEPGTLQVIMGASGSGKTTLLNCLTRRNLGPLQVTGNIRVNGQVLGDDINSLVGYVQQEDLFIGTMTVQEHLYFQAKLRMNQDLSDEDRQEQIDSVLTEMGLMKCKNTPIGIPGVVKGLSGGEKKRLAFASELLRNPPLLFCDEPTSGLDSFMAQVVMELLLKIAKGGRTVLCTVHQPSSNVFNTFDSLLLMGEGRVAYMGEINRLPGFFGRFDMACPPNFNPADFYIQNLAVVPGKEAECRKKVNAICDAFIDTSEHRQIQYIIDNNIESTQSLKMDKFIMEMEAVQKNNNKANPKDGKPWLAKQATYNASWWQQFKLLLWRSALDAKRNKRVLPTRFFQIIIASILIGFIYFQQEYDQQGIANINSALFLMMIQITFNTSFMIATAFSKEYPVFLKEYKDRAYGPTPYYLAKILVDIPVFFLSGWIFATIAYFMIGMTPGSATYVRFCFGMVLMALTAVAYGHMSSAVFPNPQLALTLLPSILGLSLIFSGFLVKEDSLPSVFKPLQDLSTYRYGYELLLINQWIDVNTLECEFSDQAHAVRQRHNITIPNANETDIHPQATPESSNWCHTLGETVIYSYGYPATLGRIDELFVIVAAFFLSTEIVGMIALTLKAKKTR